MPIKSYLAYPVEGQRAPLEAALRDLPGCDVEPASNRDLMILVTDTPDEEAERSLTARLHQLPPLLCLALVSGFADPEPAQEHRP